MSNAFAPSPYDEFEDEFDLDMGYAAMPVAGGEDEAYLNEPALTYDTEGRGPLQFTAPAVQTAPVPMQPQPVTPESALAPSAADFNPVGDLVAGAAAAFSPPVLGG